MSVEVFYTIVDDVIVTVTVYGQVGGVNAYNLCKD